MKSIYQLHKDYEKAKQNLEFTKKELVSALKTHPQFESSDRYLETLTFKHDGIIKPVSNWTGPDEIQREEYFHHYDEFPVLDLPF